MKNTGYARRLAGAIFATALAAVGAPGANATSPAVSVVACGLTTLQATLKPTADGTLVCGSGSPLRVRTELAKPNAARASVRSPLLAFLTLANLSIPDEESPLRAEFADACPGTSTTGAYRPQEALIPALVNAHVKAAGALASNPTGSPELHSNYSFAVQLGDGANNQQANEVRSFVDLLDGGKLINPDSGADGYDGAQAGDPTGGTPPLTSPVQGTSLLDLANEPFYAPGLRTGNGAPIPWFSVLGDRDVRASGIAPADNAAWQAFASAFATGQIKPGAIGADRMQALCDDPTLLTNPDFWAGLAANPAAVSVVAADPERRVVDRSAWIAEMFKTSGLPAGHGLERTRCTDADGKPLSRACYSWDQDPVHMIALDTTPAEGTGTGDIDAAQFAWLERDLIANSSRYFTTDGTKETARNRDRLVVVFMHHASSALDDPTDAQDQTKDAADLEALLLRFPNVMLQVDAQSERSEILPHRDADAKTAYWEINATSASEWPSQSRSIEIADNHDGTLSIFGVLFDAAAPPNARVARWANDHTDERHYGGTRPVNEDWLASAAREIAFNDPQRPSAPSAANRNVELVLRHPWGLTKPLRTILDIPKVPGGFGGFIPPPSVGGFLPNFPTGFPGGLPPQTFTGQPPFGQQTQNPTAPFYGGTSRGLAVTPTEGAGSYPTRIILMLLGAAAGASWLLQARVRRWMIGI